MNAGRSVADRYMRTWDLLMRYDQGEEAVGQAFVQWPELDAESARETISALAGTQDQEGFGQPGRGKIEDIIEAVKQEIFNEKLYPTPQRRAAEIFYRIVKEHPFVDGNKRIGAAMLVRYLEVADYQVSLDPTALALLAIMTAASRSEDREDITRIISLMLEESTTTI